LNGKGFPPRWLTNRRPNHPPENDCPGAVSRTATGADRKGACDGAKRSEGKHNQRPDQEPSRVAIYDGRDLIGHVERRDRTFVAISVAGIVIGTFATAPGAATALAESAAC
jgi:hypothetical protein